MIGVDIHATFYLLDEPADLPPVASEAQRRVLYEMFPRYIDPNQQSPTVPRFIANLKPAPPLPSPLLANHIQSKDLKCELLPFQQRSVFWMLNREGYTISNKGEIIPASSAFVVPPLWEQVSTSSGSTRYLNRLEGQLRKREDLQGSEPVKGGILAEEVGCGKTVESIALILLNCPTQRGPWNVNWNDVVQIPLHEVKVCFSPLVFPDSSPFTNRLP
jgi:E3 ubiquitin-protein ligase SHPRH